MFLFVLFTDQFNVVLDRVIMIFYPLGKNHVLMELTDLLIKCKYHISDNYVSHVCGKSQFISQ